MTHNPVVLRLVDRPAIDATVLFDFNDELRWPDHSSFSIGAPRLLGDPGGVGGEYDFRELSWTQVIDATNQTAMRMQSDLGRVLQRSEFYLLLQFSPTTPRFWFHCVRSSPGEVSVSTVDMDRDRNQWLVNVNLVAKAHALGDRVTLPSVTVANNPTATRGLMFTLDNIKGDAPAPLDVELAAGGTTWVRPLLTTMALQGATYPSAVVCRQAESMNLVNGSYVTTDPAYSNGQRVDFVEGSSSFTRKLEIGSFVVPFAGRYRLFVRAGVVALGPSGRQDGTYEVRGAGRSCIQPKIETLTLGGMQYLDLGVYAFPKGNMPLERPYTIGAGSVGIDVRLTAGTPVATFDFIVAVPVELPLDQAEPATFMDFFDSGVTPGNVTMRVNAARSRVEYLDSLGRHLPTDTNRISGGYPQVVPGAQNVVHLLTRRRSSAVLHADQLTSSCQLAMSYQPRHLYFADA